jgi:DNA-binding winged helix-turn-helix (wHTH) protein/TolB-like protein
MPSPASHFYKFDEFRLYSSERLLFCGTNAVTLTPKSLEILLILVQNHGRMVAKETLIKSVWPNTYVEETTLAQNIFTLRKALSRGSNSQQYISTIPKRGYRFVANVKEEWGGVGVFETPNVRDSGGESGADCENILFHKPITSLAALPLNTNGDGTTRHLADGIIANLLKKLSHLPGLKLIARSAVYRYLGKEVDPQSVGRELGVQALLVGELLHIDGHLILRIELVNVEEGWRLWGEQYNREMSDIINLQEELADEIAERLSDCLRHAAGESSTSSASIRP